MSEQNKAAEPVSASPLTPPRHGHTALGALADELALPERVKKLARGFASEWLRPNDPDSATPAMVDTLQTAMMAFFACASRLKIDVAASHADLTALVEKAEDFIVKAEKYRIHSEQWPGFSIDITGDMIEAREQLRAALRAAKEGK